MQYSKNNIMPGELNKKACDTSDTGDNSSEIRIQAAAFQWAWNTYPATRRCLFHVPNGGSRNIKEGMQLKASGVVPGIPDMVFVWKGRAYGFEFKTPVGVLSSAQREVHAIWNGQGIPVVVVRSVEEFQAAFINAITRVI